MPLRDCSEDGEICETVDEVWTYAIPMDIVYITPLQH